MRIRNKLTGNTFIAELDLRRLGSRRADFVLLLHGDQGKDTAMGRVAASLGCERVEWTPEELAALVLAGFRLPRGAGRNPTLSQVNSLLRVASRRLPTLPKGQSSFAAAKRQSHHGRAHQARSNSVPRAMPHVAGSSHVRHRDSSQSRQPARSTARRTAAALVNG